MKFYSVLQSILFFVFFFVPIMMQASPTGFVDNVTDSPIDGGLSLLVTMGIAYGARRTSAKRHKNN